MKNKYYTPTIEEFHVGFECEIKRGEEFEKYICKESILELSALAIDVNINKSFRVKYLDREDIENCGWYFKSKTPVGLDYFWSNNHLHSIIFNPNTRRLVITVRDEGRKKDYTAFVGILNNKSELKKLMQQLNII